MAIRNTENLPGSIRSTNRLPPRTRCTVRCIEEKFSVSQSSGNPMITRTWEVVSPEIININGEDKVLAGTKVQQYLPTMSMDENGERNDAKSDKALARLRDENKVLGLTYEQIDDENPALECEGVIAEANLGPDEYSMKEPPTPEELALGQKFGKDRIGEDGKPVKGYRIKLEGILSRSTSSLNQPYA